MQLTLAKSTTSLACAAVLEQVVDGALARGSNGLKTHLRQTASGASPCDVGVTPRCRSVALSASWRSVETRKQTIDG